MQVGGRHGVTMVSCGGIKRHVSVIVPPDGSENPLNTVRGLFPP